MEQAQLIEVSWKEVSKRVHQVNPIFAEHIDKISKRIKAPLFLASYPFGAHVVEQGTLLLPNPQGQVVPFNHPSISKKTQELLSYCSIPLGIWLNTTGDVYVDLDERCIPLNVFPVGAIFGLWETLDEKHTDIFSKRIWSIAAGGRAVFTLPKISDAINFKKLEKKINLKGVKLPKNIFDHAHLFREIAAQYNTQYPWHSNVLLFTKPWFEESDDPAWIQMMYYLLRKEWDQSILWRNKVTFDLVGQFFSSTQASKNLKPSAYLIDTIMNLVTIGVGARPGFAPIPPHDQTTAPVQAITKSLIEDYGLKTYIPTLMRPQYLTENNCVYYSMQIPTMLGSSYVVGKPHSVLEDMRSAKKLLELLRESLRESKSPIYNIIRHVQFDFFHSEEDLHHQIMASKTMPQGDARLIDFEDKDRVFCDSSSFIRGCVRISLAPSKKDKKAPKE